MNAISSLLKFIADKAITMKTGSASSSNWTENTASFTSFDWRQTGNVYVGYLSLKAKNAMTAGQSYTLGTLSGSSFPFSARCVITSNTGTASSSNAGAVYFTPVSNVSADSSINLRVLNMYS